MKRALFTLALLLGFATLARADLGGFPGGGFSAPLLGPNGNFTYSFSASSNTGMGYTGGNLFLSQAGTNIFAMNATGVLEESTLTFATGGSVTFSGVTTGTNADFVCMATGGVLTLQTSACTISSARFKDHIVRYRSRASAAIDALEVASFTMRPRELPNKDPNFGTRQVGLIAENVAEVAPECAIYEDDMRTPKSYRQECVIALLVKATQEQQAKIARLEQRLR